MNGRCYFISDLHLGANYFLDPREQERLVCAWLHSIAADASRLYLLGDVLDYWYEYRHVVPRGYTRFFGTLAELADRGVEITWLTGNHDIWIFDYLPAEIGFRLVDAQVLEETICGKRFVMAHGDGLGPVGFKERLMRSCFRSPLLQRAFAAIHPRWTVGFALNWSAANRRRHHTGPAALPPNPEPLLQWVEERQRSLPANQRPDFYIFGHYHTLLDRDVEGSRMLILGDWISRFSYAVFDGQSLQLKQYNPPSEIKNTL